MYEICLELRLLSSKPLFLKFQLCLLAFGSQDQFPLKLISLRSRLPLALIKPDELINLTQLHTAEASQERGYHRCIG